MNIIKLNLNGTREKIWRFGKAPFLMDANNEKSIYKKFEP